MKQSRSGIRISETGKELVIGDIFFYLVGQIIILIFAKNKMFVSLGFLMGVLISVFMTINMAITIEQAMCFKSRGAYKHVSKTSAIRMIVSFVVLVLIAFLKIGDVVGLIFGVMALKVSAYIQPFTHKVLAKKSIEKGR